MAPKTALKSIRALLDTGEFSQAAAKAKEICEQEPRNYHSHLFLGLALDKLNNADASERAYIDAIKIKDDDKTAWQGLINLYGRLGSSKVDEYATAVKGLCHIFEIADDNVCAHAAVDKYIRFTKSHGTRSQYKNALSLLLPSSPLFKMLEGLIPHPSLTYLEVIEICEAEEKEFINREIGDRRTRLGARIDQVTTEVKLEAAKRSCLEELYRGIIDWTYDDEVRRRYEEKLLQRGYDHLLNLPNSRKAEQRKYVLKSANDMVIIHHPFELAWKVVLEWQDVDEISEMDVALLREYINLFPDVGLSKVLKGFLASEFSPFPDEELDSKDQNNESSHPEPIGIENQISGEDHILLMAEGLSKSSDSILSHRLMGEVYLALEEFQTSADVSRKGLMVVLELQKRTGLNLRNVTDSINTILATSLITYQSPKNHPEAKQIFEHILKRDRTSTKCLLGLGLIYEEDEDYQEAAVFLESALQRNPNNAKVRSELFWCKARSGDLQIAKDGLEDTLALIESAGSPWRDLKPTVLYRIGQCLWELDSSPAARKDRNRAYARFLQSIQSNMNYAPAYTSLGIFYADYKKDKKRARRCFHKAIELSSSEIEAAERLARDFANQGDWDLVEAISQRVVDSGKAKPAPGSKRKGKSWPYAALGVAEINKQQYIKSIISFQTALRISPHDYHSWVGLGESYHNSGRHISAIKAFQHAQALEDMLSESDKEHTWFARYMTANVLRELGEFPEAISIYKEVLDMRPDEFGVSIALLQTLTENSWKALESGTFGEAAELAAAAIETGILVAKHHLTSINLWKAIGDAFSIFSWVKSKSDLIPISQFRRFLEEQCDVEVFQILSDLDTIGSDIEYTFALLDNETGSSVSVVAAILAYKRALSASNADVHARAVAWYNLGWAEYQAHVYHRKESSETKTKQMGFLKASMCCFKRAIELEAGNSDFWNALGVVCTSLNPKVAQHSLVRSLHINDKSASVWTNLGALQLLQNDFQLANESFTKAQSADPDFSHAWLGQALIAYLIGELGEARELVTHAFTLGNASLVLPKRQYAVSVFDHLSSGSTSEDLSHLIQSLFALHQLHAQEPSNYPVEHLSALMAERLGDVFGSISSLHIVCSKVETEYESTKSVSALFRYSQAKSDMARAQLANLKYDGAAECAEAALNLSIEDGVFEYDSNAYHKLRLSAHLTAGLAYYYLKEMDKAIDMFREALQEANSSPDIICLLAQVLWAKGGEEERDVAREQLFDCVEQHPDHIKAVTLLGVIALLDADTDAIDAVESDLRNMRTESKISIQNRANISKLLAAISSVGSSRELGLPEEDTHIQQACNSVMISPGEPQGWKSLAVASSEAFPAAMAVRTALGNIPPHGLLGANDVSRAYSLKRTRQDALKAIMVAPWIVDGWEELRQCLAKT
ncbi:Superkiller protein 3 [Ophidiomyces ophidiicola]|nr:Superkiller protein 3 [Ophidiomyces ophidiicola]